MGDFTVRTIIVLCLFAAGLALAQQPAETKPLTDKEMLENKLSKVQKVLEAETAPLNPQVKTQTYKPTGSKEIVFLTFKVMIYIAILAFLLYYGVRYFRNKAYGRSAGKKNNRSVEILESAFVGQNKNVSLVKVAGRVLVVGVTDANISLLASIEDEASVRGIMAEHQETASGVADNFSATVNGFLSKFKKSGSGVPVSSYPHNPDTDD